jgi:hypothetical protein
MNERKKKREEDKINKLNTRERKEQIEERYSNRK